MNDTITAVRALAHKNIVTLDYRVRETPLETLKTIDFQIQPGEFISQEQYAAYNLTLDHKSCLGKIAQAAAVVEKHFPQARLEVGEVLEDYLANVMLGLLKEDITRSYDPSFMQELLMYEEPHLVLLIEGQQFEPLSQALGREIVHPRVETLPLWESIAASVTISKAWPMTDPEDKLEALRTAKKLCEGLILTDENMCEPLELLGREEEAIDLVKKCYQKRPNARSLFVLSALTNSTHYYQALVNKYTEEVINYF